MGDLKLCEKCPALIFDVGGNEPPCVAKIKKLEEELEQWKPDEEYEREDARLTAEIEAMSEEEINEHLREAGIDPEESIRQLNSFVKVCKKLADARMKATQLQNHVDQRQEVIDLLLEKNQRLDSRLRTAEARCAELRGGGVVGVANAHIARLEPISQRMRGQDNRATSHPIFIVQQRRRVYGFDPAWTDDIAWIYDGAEVATSREELEKFLEEITLSEDRAYDTGALTKTGYRDRWEFVQPFFSNEGAEEYIRANRHNLDEPRIYVASGYRNDEWQAVRAVLLED